MLDKEGNIITKEQATKLLQEVLMTLAQNAVHNKRLTEYADELDRYISILAVGEKKDKNALLNYTVYQLYDEFDRYQLWLSSDMYIRAKMAGASGMQEPDDWFKDFHYDDKPKQDLKRINTI